MIESRRSPQRPKRSLGQNFLIDPNYQRKIIEAVRAVYRGETVLEVGPGRGAISKHLAGFARRLILVEKDEFLAEGLREQYADQKNVLVHTADIMDFDFAGLSDGRMLVVGNLPYNISTQILIRLLENRGFFSRLFLMFQREVARRCVSGPGSREFGILSVWCQANSVTKKLFDVPPTAFRPRPDVVSTVLGFELQTGPFTPEDRAFMDFVRQLFSARRKKIANVLKGKQDLKRLESHPALLPLLTRRADELDLQLIKVMFLALHNQ